jgi:hypothetical protein
MIPGVFSSPSSQIIGIDDVVVSLWDYFFSKSHNGIVKITSKRKKIESSDQMIVWNIGNEDPQINATNTTSTLSAFVGANSITIDELNSTLDTYKTKVSTFGRPT